MENASAYLLASDLCEKTLNEIEPGRRCRDEVQLKARVALEPPLHSGCLVCEVVVDDQVQVEMGEGFPVDLLEEFKEVHGTMARHAFADDLTGRHVEGGEQLTKPAMPASTKYSCQRQTVVLDTPTARMIAITPAPSAVRSTIFARFAIFWGTFPSPTSFSSSARSFALSVNSA